MGCLFGYCGPHDPDLLPRMAALLGHRCHAGWERTQTTIGAGLWAEFGHGRRPATTTAQVSAAPGQALAYAGVLHKALPLAELAADPARHLPQLEGAFTLALAAEGAVHLLRDHAGIKVLYWTLHKGRLLFASEVKALFADSTLARRLRLSALPEYLTFSFIPGRGTMFEGIEELQPGTQLRYAAGHVTLHRHFCFETLEHSAPDRDHVAALRADLALSVREAISHSRQTPGVFLSGGIDSSSVLALLAQALPGVAIPTFSVHFGPEYPNENDFIRLMTERYRCDHHVLEIRPQDFMDELRAIVWRLDEPIGDPVTMPNYLLARAAAAVTDTVLNGEGGDPCFGGPKNVPMLLAQLYGPAADEPAAGFLERQYLHSFQRCYADLDLLLTPAALTAAGGVAALTALITPFLHDSPPTDFLNRLMAMNIRLKGANLILVKVDKMSSAHGLLALPPLFTRRIIEGAIQCPPALKLAGTVEKNVLKQAVADLVPQPIIDRPKSGMMVPVRFWFRGELARYGRQVLQPSAVKQLGLFAPAYVQQLLDYDMESVRGQRHGLKLWMLLTFLLWHEQFIDHPPAPGAVPPLRFTAGVDLKPDALSCPVRPDAPVPPR